MRHLKRVVAACLALLLMVQATGCASWRTVTQPLPETLVQHPNRKVRVTLQDGRTIEADSAQAGADALIMFQREGVDTIPLARCKRSRCDYPAPGRRWDWCSASGQFCLWPSQLFSSMRSASISGRRR